MTTIPDDEGPCTTAEAMAEVFHAIDHVLTKLWARGCKGDDAALLAAYQPLIAQCLQILDGARLGEWAEDMEETLTA